jgi:hypothetical protein
MSEYISAENHETALYGAARRRHQIALVGRLREFESLDIVGAASSQEPEWFTYEGQAGVDASGLDHDFDRIPAQITDEDQDAIIEGEL